MINRILFCITILSAIWGSSFAQITLVADINPGSGDGLPPVLNPHIFRNKLLFIANDGINGFELWQIDTNDKSILIKDFNPGPGHSYIHSVDMPVIKDTVYFAAYNGPGYYSLYKWDGINQPQIITPNVNIYGSASLHVPMVYLNGILYYNGQGTNGVELFGYDLSTHTQRELGDIYPGIASSVPTDLIEYNGKLYFRARNGLSSYGIYVYDPITDTITLVYDFESGIGGSSYKMLAKWDSKLLFVITTTQYGTELYELSVDTPKRLTDLFPNSMHTYAGVFFDDLGFFNNCIYFSAADSSGYQLYKYDTLTKNSAYVANIWPISNYVVYANKLFFIGIDSMNNTALWSVNGTDTPKTEFNIQTPDYAQFFPYPKMAVFNNAIYLPIDDNTIGLEYYKYIDSSVYASDIDLSSTATMYPNPTNSLINIRIDLDYPEQLKIIITDIVGNIIYYREAKIYASGTNNIIVSTASFRQGVYYCHVLNNKNTARYSGKLFKL